MKWGLSKIDLAIYALAAVLLLGFAGVVLKWKNDSAKLKVERSEHRSQVEQLNGKIDERDRLIAQERANATKARQASNDYQQELEDLRKARAATPARSVRLCVPAVAVPSTAGGSDAAGPEGLPETSGRDTRAGNGHGPDIGRELYDLADEADQCAAQRDALIDWLISTTATQ